MHLGIDPGLKGALALVDNSGQLLWTSALPVVTLKNGKHELDEGALKEKLLSAKGTADMLVMAHLEKVSAMPKQGVTSMFTFGCGWGMVRGLLCGLGIPYDLITPQAWQKLMLAGLPKGSELLVARRLWPGHSFIMEGCRVPHEGAVDAALIAEAGRRMWKGGGA